MSKFLPGFFPIFQNRNKNYLLEKKILVLKHISVYLEEILSIAWLGAPAALL